MSAVVIALTPYLMRSAMADIGGLRGAVANATSSGETPGLQLLSLSQRPEAFCSAHAACTGLSGFCCPTFEGVNLGCCSETLPESPPSQPPVPQGPQSPDSQHQTPEAPDGHDSPDSEHRMPEDPDGTDSTDSEHLPDMIPGLHQMPEDPVGPDSPNSEHLPGLHHMPEDPAGPDSPDSEHPMPEGHEPPDSQHALRKGKLATLYHTTSSTAAEAIVATNFRAGSNGWCGAAIYLMDFPGLPEAKMDPVHSQTGAIIEATVDLGKICVIERPAGCDDGSSGRCCPAPNGAGFGTTGAAQAGCNSIKWNPGDGWEYVIWEPGRVLSKKVLCSGRSACLASCQAVGRSPTECGGQ